MRDVIMEHAALNMSEFNEDIALLFLRWLLDSSKNKFKKIILNEFTKKMRNFKCRRRKCDYATYSNSDLDVI